MSDVNPGYAPHEQEVIDILDRLREPQGRSMYAQVTDLVLVLMREREEAADEIERLRAALKQAQEALA